ncbi:MAG: hypothetical protein ABR517_08075 [Thermoanaerobaculia bacterium]
MAMMTSRWGPAGRERASATEIPAEQSVQHRLVEVDAHQHQLELIHHFRLHGPDGDQTERHDEGDQHYADRHRKADEAVIEVAENGRKGDQHRDDVDQAHV